MRKVNSFRDAVDKSLVRVRPYEIFQLWKGNLMGNLRR